MTGKVLAVGEYLQGLPCRERIKAERAITGGRQVSRLYSVTATAKGPGGVKYSHTSEICSLNPFLLMQEAAAKWASVFIFAKGEGGPLLPLESFTEVRVELSELIVEDLHE